MENIIVSICCITYNHEKYIEDAIKSFLMQKTNFDYEILIHDDASTDKTSQIIEKYQKKYPKKIKVIYQTENQYSLGVDVLRILYNKAKGKYIAICEGDDFWTDKNKLQKQVDYMEKHQSCSGCFHAADIINEEKKEKIGEIKPYNKDKILTTEEIILGGGGFVATNSIFCLTKFLKNFPNFYKVSPVQDYPTQILISLYGYVYYMADTMSVYRSNTPGSWTERLESLKEKELKEKKKKLHEKLILMLKELDSYSSKKYSKCIDKKIREFEFRNLLLENNLKELKKIKYKEWYNKISKGNRVKLYIQYYSPAFYEVLKKIYHRRSKNERR